MAGNEDKLVTLGTLAYFYSKLQTKFVAMEAGKGLSTNDFTTELKNKLDSIVTGDGDEYVTTSDIDALFEDEEETVEAGAGEGSAEGGGASLDEQDGPTE